MNQRIKELAEEAKGFVDLNQHVGGTRGCMVYTYDGLEKFAELIILECVNAVMDGTKEGDHYAQKIEQHFDNGTGGIVHFGVEL